MPDWTEIARAELVLPLVNMNGTSREALIAQHLDGAAAMRHAHEAMRESVPHGRDHPRMADGTDTMAAARRQHQAWVDAITRIAIEMEQVAERLHEGQPKARAA